MDTSPEVSRSHLVSVILSSLGWIVAAGVLVWFVIFGKEAYRQAGYAQGTADQNTIDSGRYAAVHGEATNLPDLNNIVNVRVLRVQPGSITGEELKLGVTTPFEGTPTKQYTVVYDEQTEIVRRIIISPEEHDRRVAAANEAGQNPMLIAPFDDVPASVSDIGAGMRLEITVRDSRSLAGTSVAASHIAIVAELPVSQPTQ